MDSELFEQLRLLPMMPQEPRVCFKVQEHQVHTRTQRPLLQDRTVKMLDWHQVHVGANQSFAG